jgi:carboxyl-terminal processing protease
MFALVALVICPLVGSDLRGQGQRQPVPPKPVMKVAAALLQHGHLSERPLDDKLSSQAFDAYFSSLDGLKLYFLAADLSEFEAHRTKLDDALKAGDLTFANQVFNRFLKRVDERVALVQEILSKPLDFSVREDFVTDGDYRSWPRGEEEVRTIWTQRIKADILALRADKAPEAEIAERLNKRYTRFQERIKQETEEDILTRFVNSIATCYDPHTDFMPPKAFQDFEMGLTLNYQGIGAVLEDQDGTIAIQRIMPGGAVEKYGKLMVKDRIVAVGQGESGPMVDVVGMRINDAVKLIRGPENTIVRLAVRPAAGGPEITHSIMRARIPYEDSVAKGQIIEHGDKGEGKPWRMGVIDLPSFYRDQEPPGSTKPPRSSTRDIDRILKDFVRDEVDVVILDLRRNGGGYLPEAVGVSGLFIDQGPVVQVKGGRRLRVLDDTQAGHSWTGPLVVLVSQLSASASEIVAGAVADYERGLVIGDRKTHGKGTVQSPIDVAEQIDHPLGPGTLGVLKLTIQQFYRPDGKSTQLEGVRSHVEIPSWTNVMDVGEESVPHALAADAIRAAPHKNEGAIGEDLLKKLRESSAHRRSMSSYWLDLERQLSAYTQFRLRRSIPLEESAYMALQETMRSEQQAATEPASEDDKTRDPYKEPWFKEVLEITGEYATASRTRGA